MHHLGKGHDQSYLGVADLSETANAKGLGTWGDFDRWTGKYGK